MLYERRYHVIYSPLPLYAEIIEILTQTIGKRSLSIRFLITITKTAVISRRKKIGKRQGRICSIYEYCRFFLDDNDFIPCCVALRLAGYGLKEVHF
jgi:hypothetical protein